MVEYSKENLKKFLKKDSYVNHKNNISNYDFEKLNAKFIEESKFLNKADLIITE
ncbi:MAG: hypothetical protein LBU14_04610 [Candidatus Peribacteria bacterium]|jgi:hypothetical protein|nr:hypothetical protein [Candidatus Peribacteria bacterium]